MFGKRETQIDFEAALAATTSAAILEADERAQQLEAENAKARAAIDAKRREQLLKMNGESVLDEIDGELASVHREAERLRVGREALAGRLVEVREREAEAELEEERQAERALAEEGAGLYLQLDALMVEAASHCARLAEIESHSNNSKLNVGGPRDLLRSRGKIPGGGGVRYMVDELVLKSVLQGRTIWNGRG